MRHRILLPLLLLLGLAGPLAAQTERVLIVGDSWAELTWAFGSLDKALARVGHGDKIAVGDTTAIGGTTAEQWNSASYQALISQELAAHPSIDVIHLNVGGNDFLGAWNTGMSVSEEQALYQQIADDVEGLVQFLHGIDPDLQVVFVGYDYINLEEMRSDPFTFLLWLALGLPSPGRVNRALFDSSATVYQRLAADPTVHFLNHAGLMQWVFGYPAHGIAPRSTPLPGNAHNGYRPALGGDPALPSPPAAMLDGIHLNPAGYDAVTLHCAVRFYDSWFDANP